MMPLTFPSTLETFIAYQEQLINRPLTETEREVTVAWLEIINQAEPESVQAVDELIAQHSSDEWITRFLTEVKAWMALSMANL